MEERINYKAIKKAKNNPNVYLVESNKCFKIGVSKDIKSRIRNFNTANPNEVQLIGSGYFEEPYDAEKRIHNKYISKRKKGEWFCLSKKEVKEVVQILGSSVDMEIINNIFLEKESIIKPETKVKKQKNHAINFSTIQVLMFSSLAIMTGLLGIMILIIIK